MLFTVIKREFAEEEMCVYLLLGQDIYTAVYENTALQNTCSSANNTLKIPPLGDRNKIMISLKRD